MFYRLSVEWYLEKMAFWSIISDCECLWKNPYMWLRICRTITSTELKQSSNNERASMYSRRNFLAINPFAHSFIRMPHSTLAHAGKRNKTFGKNNYLSGSRCSAQWGKMSRSYKYHAAGKSRHVSGPRMLRRIKGKDLWRAGRRPLEEK